MAYIGLIKIARRNQLVNAPESGAVHFTVPFVRKRTRVRARELRWRFG